MSRSRPWGADTAAAGDRARSPAERWAPAAGRVPAGGRVPVRQPSRSRPGRSRHRSFEEGPRYDHSLDLVGALVDLCDLRVTHHPLDRIVADVAVAAEELYAVGGHLHGHVR